MAPNFAKPRLPAKLPREIQEVFLSLTPEQLNTVRGLVTQNDHSDFLNLPLEIREMIYKYVVLPESRKLRAKVKNRDTKFDPPLLYVSKFIHDEANRIIFENVTYKVTTNIDEQELYEDNVFALTHFRKLHLEVLLDSWFIPQDDTDYLEDLVCFQERTATILSNRIDKANVNLRISFVPSNLQTRMRVDDDGNDIFDPSYKSETPRPRMASSWWVSNHVREDEYKIAWLRAHSLELVRRLRNDLLSRAPFVPLKTNVEKNGHNIRVDWTGEERWRYHLWI